jgi:SulP family sulfate permease
LADQLHNSGRSMLVCGARPQPLALMHEAGFERHVGAENICENITEALKRAEQLQAERLAPADQIPHPV